MERWMSIRNYEGYYEVSDFGNVKSVERTVRRRDGHTHFVKEKILRQHVNHNGLSYVSLSMNGILKSHNVHKLVAEAFLRPRKSNEHVIHIDMNYRNNNLSNLAIVDAFQNKSDRMSGQNGKLTENEVITIYQIARYSLHRSQREIAKDFGVADTVVSKICNGTLWSHLGLEPFKRAGSPRRVVLLDEE